MKINQILFVTQTDTARGPMAAYIMREKHILKDIQVTSRGVVVLFPEPMNPKAEVILGKHGIIPKGHQSRELEEKDMSKGTIILTMDDSLCLKLRKRYPKFKDIYLFSEYIGLEGNILNPYGANLEEYDKCYETIEGMVKLLVLQLSEEV